MLATSRSAGVTPEVNLSNPLHTSDEMCKSGNLALKPGADITGSPKQGYQWPTKRTMYSQNVFKKSDEKTNTTLRSIDTEL